MMKLRILIFLGLAGLFAFTNMAQAQTGWKTGLVALPGLSTFYNSDDEANLNPPASKRGLVPGMTGGLMLGYNAGNFIVRLNTLYSQQGNRLSLNSITNGLGGNSVCSYRGDEYLCTHYTTRLEYFKVPLMFGFQTGDSFEPSRFAFSVLVGGQASFLTKARMYDNDSNFSPSIGSNITSYPDAFEQFEPIVYSGILDFGLDINLDEDIQMNIHVRGEYGITDVENKGASFRITEGGQTTDRFLYPDGRAITNTISAGVMIGLTYNLRSRWN
ncbi:MAG: outer membrane beta-barrel protein [Bacteroidia bacterium]